MSIEKEAWVQIIADERQLERLRREKDSDPKSYLRALDRIGKVTSLPRKELLDYLYRGYIQELGISLAGVKLVNAELVGIDLSGINLSGAQIKWTALNGADLRNADLRGAKIEQSFLEASNLSGANLSNALFDYTYLTYADLSHANLRGAYLLGSPGYFAGVNIEGADIQGVHYSANRPTEDIFEFAKGSPKNAQKKLSYGLVPVSEILVEEVMDAVIDLASRIVHDKPEAGKAVVNRAFYMENVTGEHIRFQIGVNFSPSYRALDGGMISPDKKYLLVTFGHSATPYFIEGLKEEGRTRQSLRDTVIHELTHLRDARVKGEWPQPDDPKSYFNFPQELKGYLRNIYEDMLAEMKEFEGLEDPEDFNATFRDLLRDSKHWNTLEPHLEEVNKQKILKGLYIGLKKALEGP